MHLNKLFDKNNEKKSVKFLVYLFFSFFLLVGIIIYKDYGLSIDEPFHRTTGHFWYYMLISKFLPNLESLTALKSYINEMEWSYDFFDGKFNEYGPIFDLLSVLFEYLFNITSAEQAYKLKHFLTFITFFTSGIFFYKTINLRFENKIFTILITFFYFSSPRIFAESFYNCKDIVFMSFCVLSIYYLLKSFEKTSLKNIILFSLFSAIATQIRIAGVQLIFLYLIFFLFEALENKNYFKKYKLVFFVCFLSFFFFLILFWPFLWENPIANFVKIFFIFSNYHWSFDVFYLGKYVKASNLPWHYIPMWIFVSTPLMYIFFYIIGIFITGRSLFLNFLNLSETSDKKLWNEKNQKKDFLMFFYILSPVFVIIIFNSTIYGGWRHLYFIYPGLMYMFALSVNFIFNKLRSYKIKKIIYLLTILFCINNIYILIKLHPYQNVYFNYVVEKKANRLFEIDYWGLANREAINYIINTEDLKKNISIRTASFTPLSYSKKILKENDTAKFQFDGTTNLNQDYVFTNYHYEKDPKFLKKYFIPKDYKKVFTIKRGNIIINEIYKKN